MIVRYLIVGFLIEESQLAPQKIEYFHLKGWKDLEGREHLEIGVNENAWSEPILLEIFL